MLSKRLYLPIIPHGVTTQNSNFGIFNTVRDSYLISVEIVDKFRRLSKRWGGERRCNGRKNPETSARRRSLLRVITERA